MKSRYISKQSFVVASVLIGLLVFSVQIISAQIKPLTLAQVMTGLQSQSGGFTLREKNTFITKNVREKGVTFKLTPEIEKELRTIGASEILIRAIRTKTARTTTPANVKPNVTYDKIWVVPDVVEKGVKGIRIFANFNVYNLKGVKSDLVYRFQRNGKMLKTTTVGYRTKSGELSGRRYLLPTYRAAVYEDLATFVPYSAFNLAPGTYNLKLDADVIKREGTIIKHLTLQDLRLVIPARTTNLVKGSGELKKLWIDYGVRQKGELGMQIHVKMNVKNLKDQYAYLRILFTKQDGTKLRGLTPLYNKDGQTSVFRRIRPIYTSSNFNDVTLFIPYKEFGLQVGKYILRLHADLVDSQYQQLSHLTYKGFSYTQRRI